MNLPLNIAVIGCGRIAGHHCNSIAEIKKIKLTAVCDLIEEKARNYGDKFCVPWFVNYNEMFETYPEIDIAAIITPSGMHYEHGVEIMQCYKKHLVMEKPTFMRPTQLTSAYDIATKLGLKIFPIFQNRYNKAVIRVKKAIQSGQLGDVRVMSVRTRWCRPQRYYELAPWRGTFSHDGGALANQGVHHVDLLRHLGGEVTRVNAVMRTLGVDIEVEDTVVGTFVYNDNKVGNLEVTTAARPEDFEASLSIVGSKGLAQIGGIAVNELQIFTPDPPACTTHTEDFSDCVYGNGHKKIYDDIVAFFYDSKPFPISGGDALASLKLLHAFYRSDEVGQWVGVSSNEQSVRLGQSNEKISKIYRAPKPCPSA